MVSNVYQTHKSLAKDHIHTSAATGAARPCEMPYNHNQVQVGSTKQLSIYEEQILDHEMYAYIARIQVSMDRVLVCRAKNKAYFLALGSTCSSLESFFAKNVLQVPPALVDIAQINLLR